MIRNMLPAVLCLLTVSLHAIAQLSEPLPPMHPPAPPTAPAAASARPFVGLWVTRWDYRAQHDVAECIDRAAAVGATDVFWQVRGQADAYFRSSLEPWGRELFRDLPADATDPGFDPLDLAVRLAHQRGLKLHAWVNIMPLWKGKEPPADPKHPFNLHPEWRLHDAKGTPQALNDHYVIVNPLLPAVHEHVVAVCKDIVTRYPVDGLHMDYVRFVSDTMTDPSAYPCDPESIEIFERASGHKWTGSDADKATLRDLKRDRITALVKRIRTEAVSARPGVAFTAAVWRRPDLARDSYLQDAAAWLNDGTLDRACPMIYTKDDKQFAGDITAWTAACPGRAITPGLGIYLHAPNASASQFDIAAAAHASGFALFAYASLYESVDPNQDKAPAKVAERSERLKEITAEVIRRTPAAVSSPTPGSTPP
jgi:uncharacterized lipoprotein YddW (UPF0748 family)